MKIKLNYLILAPLMSMIMISCSHQNNIFNKNEIYKFNNIVHAFDKILMDKYKLNDKLNYAKFSKEFISKVQKNQAPPLNAEILNLLQKIKKDKLYLDIWGVSQSECKCLFCCTDKYFLFIENNTQNSVISKYIDVVNNLGDVTASNSLYLMKNINKIDIDKFENRLVIVVNILSTYATMYDNIGKY